jgi:protein-tyrosine phosphatase
MGMNTIRWISGIEPGKLTVSARPYGGEDLEAEIQNWKKCGVSTVVSALETREEARLALAEERALCGKHGIAFLSYPIRDHSVPDSLIGVHALAKDLEARMSLGEGVLIHCFAGLGRSVTLAACVMALRGIPPDFAFEWIGEARCETNLPEKEDQREWVLNFYKRFGT